MNYKSQYGQDRFLNENFFKNKKNGVFVDIGAHDGVTLSNSYFFEKDLEWFGLCIEPIPFLFEKLNENRKCIKVNGCAWSENTTKKFRIINGYSEMLSGIVDCYNTEHVKRIDNECKTENGNYEDVDMVCYKLNDLLEENKLFKIDFLSIDTEGSELEILKSIDFDKFDIQIILVENNYNDNSLREFLQSKNFKLNNKLSIDDVFIKK